MRTGLAGHRKRFGNGEMKLLAALDRWAPDAGHAKGTVMRAAMVANAKTSDVGPHKRCQSATSEH